MLDAITFVLIATAILLLANTAQAASRAKANNTNNLNATASWATGVVPGNADMALWNNGVLSANTTVLGADLNFGQIQISNPAGAVQINSGNTLTLSAISGVGIDMSTATQNLTLNCNIIIGAAQSWNINNGKTLTLGGTVELNGANNLTISSLSGSGTIQNTGTNNTTPVLTVGSNNDSTTFSGQINKGNGNRNVALTKVGTGTLTLTNSNTYNSGTTLKAGTIVAGNNTALGTAAVLFGDTTGSSNASLFTNGAFTIGNVVTVQSGNTGVMTLGGNTAAASSFIGAVNLGTASGTAKGGTFVALAGGSVDFTGVINESTSVPASNVTIGDSTHSGTVKFSNVANAYSGTTTIGNGGMLEVTKLAAGGINSSIGNSGSAAAAGSAASDLVLDNGTLKYTGTGDSTNRLFTFTTNGATIDASASANGALSFTGTGSLVASGNGTRTLTLTGTSTGANTMTSIIGNPSSGTTALTKSGTGTWVVNGANSYTGATTISAGTLQLGNGGTTGSLSSSSAISDSGNFTINRSNAVSQGTDFSGGAISGSGSFTQAGGGTTTLNAANSYTGGTNVNAGTLALGASNVLANSGAVNVNGGTLDVGGNSDTVGVVTLTTGNMNGTTGTLTGSSYGVQSGNISAKLGGSGALTKSAAGTVILTGGNSYTGGTNVNAGILALNASSVLPDTGTVGLGGGRLQLNGTQEGTTATAGAGALALTSASIIDLASTDLIHFLASNGQGWGSNTLKIFNWSGTPMTGGGAEQILFGSNTSSLTPGQLNLITFYSDGGITSLGTAAFATANDGEIVPTFQAIPEPGTWVAGALVFASLLVAQRRRFARLLQRA